MSMNLHCQEVELWQTPTHITKMCIETVTEDGKIIEDNWKSILHKYTLWAQSTLDGVYSTEEEAKEAHEHLEEHIKDLTYYPELHFFVL